MSSYSPVGSDESHAWINTGDHLDEDATASQIDLPSPSPSLRSESPAFTFGGNAQSPPSSNAKPYEEYTALSVREISEDLPQKAPKRMEHKPQRSLCDVKDGRLSLRLYQRLLYDSWVPELAALVFSAICLVTASVILACFNDRPASDFQSALSLNAVVAILSAATRISLAFVMTSTLGQWKWCRVSHQPRRLKELQDIDLASRGPLGSLFLLFSPTAFTLGTIGAAVLILALAIDTFLQQSIRIEVQFRATDSTEAAAKSADWYPNVVVGEGDVNFYGMIQSVIWGDAYHIDQPSCPTGYCKWPDFEFTGWCSDCETDKELSRWQGCQVNLTNYNLTDFYGQETGIPCNITYTNPLGEMTWPAQVRIDVQADEADLNEPWVLFNLLGPSSFITSLNIEAVRQGFHLDFEVDDGVFTNLYENGAVAGIMNPLYPKTFVSLQWTYDSESHVLQSHVNQTIDCALSRCRKTLDLEVNNGTFQMRAKPSRMMTEYVPRFFSEYNLAPGPEYLCYRVLAGPAPIWPLDMDEVLPGTHFDDGDDEPLSQWSYTDQETLCTCITARGDLMSERPYLENLFEGSSTTFVAPRIFANGTLDPYPLMYGHALLREILNADMFFAKLDNGTRLPQAMHNVTTVLDVVGLRASEQSMTGTVYASTGVILVQWQWLILPVCLEVLGAVFLALVIIRTKQYKVPLWKSSILPFVYHGVEREELSPGSFNTTGDMLRDAQKTSVDLTACADDGLGKRLRLLAR